MSSYDYVTVGHVTIDVLADGTRRPGGTALYSALQAARLGLRTLILTRGVPAEIEGLLEPYRDELDLRVLPAEHTTTLQTVGEGLARHQRLLAWAGPIEGPIEVDTAILHLAPVARETPREFRDAGLPRADAAHLPHADAAHPPHADVAHPPTHPPHAHDGPPLQAEFVGLTPQGLVREWDAAGEIALVPLRPEQLPERCDAWVLSERERECCAEPAARATAGGTVVAVTAGDAPHRAAAAGRPTAACPGATDRGARRGPRRRRRVRRRLLHRAARGPTARASRRLRQRRRLGTRRRGGARRDRRSPRDHGAEARKPCPAFRTVVLRVAKSNTLTVPRRTWVKVPSQRSAVLQLVPRTVAAL